MRCVAIMWRDCFGAGVAHHQTRKRSKPTHRVLKPSPKTKFPRPRATSQRRLRITRKVVLVLCCSAHGCSIDQYSAHGAGMPTNKLLRTITGRRHTKTCHELFNEEATLAPSEFAALDVDNTGTISIQQWTVRFGSEEGFAEYDANDDGGIDQQEFLQAKQMLAIAGLVKDALGEGWANVEAKDIQVKDKSGGGGSTCYKVSAAGAIPETVALHSRSETAATDIIGEAILKAAGSASAQHGVGPKRLAQGEDWNIEPWEGLGEPVMDSVQKFEMLGRLLARIHRLPTSWLDECECMEKIYASHPFLRDCHPGHILNRVAKVSEKPWLKELLTLPGIEEIFTSASKEYLYPPVTEAARRVVTIHGDFHKGNVIQMPDCMRAIDFDGAGVGYAINDITYVICWVDEEWFKDNGVGDLSREELVERKRGFAAAYLSAMGDSATPADVDALLLDAQLGMHQCWAGGSSWYTSKIMTLPPWTAEMLSLASEADLNAVHEQLRSIPSCAIISPFMNFGAGPFNAYSNTVATFVAQARQDPTTCQALFLQGTWRVYRDWLETKL